ncbi:MAG: flavin reductase family protein [Bryobacteraceae bacterium]|nr:flavin reductase family protein [Bryobacteraceae bacterium]
MSRAAAATPPAELRRAWGQFATGIAVATVCDDGNPHGLTVNSFTSVSLNPPLISIAIDRASTVLPHLKAAESFAVNVLRDSQRELSIRFAQWPEGRFEGLEWSLGEQGAPLFPGMLAIFECRKTQAIEAGDHVLFLGEVMRFAWEEGEPLVYFASRYRELKAD